MQMLLSDIARIVQGKLFGTDEAISSVSIDTRTLLSGQLYVAIKGKNYDGNDFVNLAEQAGAKAAIVHKEIKPSIPYISVTDTRLALAELAGYWRLASSAKLVGITGSNGKTTVKEMLATILNVAGNVLFTQGNLNNDIGVPLTLLRLNEDHQYAVVEMGANHHGEIAFTSQYAQPDVVILNNAGPAHLQGFGSIDGVAKAKSEIISTLKSSGIAILNKEDKYFSYWQDIAGNRKTVSFGFDNSADIFAKNIDFKLIKHRFVTTFTLHTKENFINIQLPLAGRHNVLNALAASAAALALGLNLNQVAIGLELVQPVTGRLQLLAGHQGSLVIDDTYNGNSASLSVGLNILQETSKEQWLVLGAFGELGSESEIIHKKMGIDIKASGVKKLFALGDDCQHTVSTFGEGAKYFTNQDELIKTIQQELTGKEAILIKGSRARHMENVVAALTDNFRK